LLEDLQARQKRLTRLVIKSGGRIVFLRVDEIDWLEAADNYVRIHAGRDSHLHHGAYGRNRGSPPDSRTACENPSLERKQPMPSC
jgi:hypothetical protein